MSGLEPTEVSETARERRVLALLRHGDYEQPDGVPSAHLPHALTDRGRDQARSSATGLWTFARAQRLALDPVIDSSSLRRAWETASLLADELGRLSGEPLRVEPFDGLAERCLGAGANLTLEAIERALASDPRFGPPPNGWKRAPRYRLPWIGAESLMDAGARVARHLVARARESRAGSSLKLIVGHGGALRHAACQLGLLTEPELAALSMHHCDPIYVEADAAGVFAHTAGAWKRRTAESPLD
jgi:2,3-bisphosphoglycerate-dependent phosphoglycerate mutase